MILKIIKRIKRAPVSAIAVLLFAVIISMIICALQASNEAELRNYEEMWQSVPITVTVTDPTGKNDGDLLISPWILSIFTDDTPVKFYDDSAEKKYSDPVEELSLAEYLKDIQSMMYTPISTINGTNYTSAAGTTMLYGITSLPCDKQLLPENGCEITWYDSYDETVFGSEELVCLVPSGKAEAYDNGSGEAVLYFYYAYGRTENGTYVEVSRTEYECTLKIVGTYTAGDEMSIYCPFSIIEQVYAGLDEKLSPDSISATLTDNLLLDEFCEKASRFYSNLLDDPKAASKVLNVSNRSKIILAAQIIMPWT